MNTKNQNNKKNNNLKPYQRILLNIIRYVIRIFIATLLFVILILYYLFKLPADALYFIVNCFDRLFNLVFENEKVWNMLSYIPKNK